MWELSLMEILIATNSTICIPSIFSIFNSIWKVWTRILVFSLLNPNLCPRSSGTVNVFYDELLMNEDSDNKVSKRGKKQVVNLDESLGVMNKEAIFCSVNRFANCLTHWAWTTGSSTRLTEVLKDHWKQRRGHSQIVRWKIKNRMSK